MNILVTGGAGYIGSHFVKAVENTDLTPVIFDSLLTGHPWATRSHKLYRTNLSDRAALERVLRDERIGAVVHFAGSISVGESVIDPSLYFHNNYVCTLTLLDAMVSTGVKER